MLSLRTNHTLSTIFMSKNTLHIYFCSGDLDLEQVTLAKCEKNQIVTTVDDYSNLYVQKLTFYFHDLDLDPMTLVLKLDLDIVVTY